MTTVDWEHDDHRIRLVVASNRPQNRAIFASVLHRRDAPVLLYHSQPVARRPNTMANPLLPKPHATSSVVLPV
ncbi:hypothetical protein MMC28_010408 [Mycoblastus sanguinarius]|nr:hypothetical protein [Mycoblastus sanguinarius]